MRANRDKESKKRLITSRSLYYILSKALSFYFIGLGFRCINSALKRSTDVSDERYKASSRSASVRLISRFLLALLFVQD